MRHVRDRAPRLPLLLGAVALTWAGTVRAQVSTDTVFPGERWEYVARENLVAHGITPAAPILAFSGNGSIEKELDMEASNPIESIPTEYRLEQNYPNPFNPSTAIRFAVPADGNVSLKVYNAIGQEVATLVNGFTPAGRHEVVWDAKNCPSGIYIYRVVAGSAVETKKMTLMK